jgi:5-methylcytosine-specific restriction enzyme A
MSVTSFEIGVSYPRGDLLGFCGSRQGQTGVVWGDREPGCLVVTSGGKAKARVGYEDGPGLGGTYYYFGQGRVGDQETKRAANRLLLEGARTVLLFLTREPTANEVRSREGSHAKLYTFNGYYEVGAWDYYIPPAGPRAGDRLLRFQLVPTSSVQRPQPPAATSVDSPGAAARLREMIDSGPRGPTRGQLDARDYVLRSRLVREYAMLVGAGKCELCMAAAPFVTPEGHPFLEVHHLRRLGDGGPDTPGNVAALCPNCHRAVHHSRERDALGRNLADRVRRREEAVMTELPASAMPSTPVYEDLA